MLLANKFMEWLEQTVFATAPEAPKLKLWKRYVDDILETINKGEVENFTEHLDTIHPTGSIKFTHELEQEGKIPFLDTLITRKPYHNIKLQVYRKSTHTDQYSAFDSLHPLQHKLRVVRTWYDRCLNIVSLESDKANEIKHIDAALRTCGYPA